MQSRIVEALVKDPFLGHRIAEEAGRDAVDAVHLETEGAAHGGGHRFAQNGAGDDKALFRRREMNRAATPARTTGFPTEQLGGKTVNAAALGQVVVVGTVVAVGHIVLAQRMTDAHRGGFLSHPEVGGRAHLLLPIAFGERQLRLADQQKHLVHLNTGLVEILHSGSPSCHDYFASMLSRFAAGGRPFPLSETPNRRPGL